MASLNPFETKRKKARIGASSRVREWFVADRKSAINYSEAIQKGAILTDKHMFFIGCTSEIISDVSGCSCMILGTEMGTGVPTKRLTAAQVRAASKPGKYYDEHGLFMRVEASGSKRWVQRLTVNGRSREIGLGSAELVSLAEARAQAYDNRRLARQGGDPIAARARSKAVPTFEQAAHEVYEAHRPTWKNAKHAAQFISTLETYAFPTLGSKPVAEVTTSDILTVLSPIWTSKTETARRVRQRIGTIMRWCVAKGYRPDDPTSSVHLALPQVKSKVAHRRALPYDEVATCLSTVQASGASTSTKLALEFLILTAARSGEVRGAIWAEIDLTQGVWVVPAERMKAGAEHKVPLSPRALKILEEAKCLSDGSDLVFPGMKPGRPLSDMTLSKLIKELGYQADVHGFRTSFRTWAQEKTNLQGEVVEKALAHAVKNKVEAAYARSDLFEKRRVLMAAWADYLSGQEGTVVPLREQV
ncbi:Integrase [Jannaschia faecimaris]|uniref:Integrase n=1 Tax=Jannaschia faecimaris TaxID=1244108 RepID=A0A1H3UA46_9RHOB|nr:site-specific integrase [Jannaschia faecimaris]SDZ58449.1 Integrase [Jannaschia faecimaris]